MNVGFFAFRTNPPAVPPSKSASAISMTIFSTLTPASRPHSLPASNNDSRAFRMMDLPCPKLQNGHGLRYDPDHADMNCRYVAPNLAWAECEERNPSSMAKQMKLKLPNKQAGYPAEHFFPSLHSFSFVAVKSPCLATVELDVLTHRGNLPKELEDRVVEEEETMKTSRKPNRERLFTSLFGESHHSDHASKSTLRRVSCSIFSLSAVFIVVDETEDAPLSSLELIPPLAVDNPPLLISFSGNRFFMARICR
eukprot:CCRYP_008928-RD/>CCRYP_008928-RD protein AED:0.48 eAED:0.49 QI:0/0/0/1/0/0/4/0/251